MESDQITRFPNRFTGRRLSQMHSFGRGRSPAAAPGTRVQRADRKEPSLAPRHSASSRVPRTTPWASDTEAEPFAPGTARPETHATFRWRNLNRGQVVSVASGYGAIGKRCTTFKAGAFRVTRFRLASMPRALASCQTGFSRHGSGVRWTRYHAAEIELTMFCVAHRPSQNLPEKK